MIGVFFRPKLPGAIDQEEKRNLAQYPRFQEQRAPMTKSELYVKLSDRFPQLVQKDIEISVQFVLGTLHATLAKGGRVEIRGFGSFSLAYRPPRVGRNPKTGEQVSVPGKYAPHFKAGKELRDRVLCHAP